MIMPRRALWIFPSCHFVCEEMLKRFEGKAVLPSGNTFLLARFDLPGRCRKTGNLAEYWMQKDLKMWQVQLACEMDLERLKVEDPSGCTMFLLCESA